MLFRLSDFPTYDLIPHDKVDYAALPRFVFPSATWWSGFFARFETLTAKPDYYEALLVRVDGWLSGRFPQGPDDPPGELLALALARKPFVAITGVPQGLQRTLRDSASGRWIVPASVPTIVVSGVSTDRDPLRRVHLRDRLLATLFPEENACVLDLATMTLLRPSGFLVQVADYQTPTPYTFSEEETPAHDRHYY